MIADAHKNLNPHVSRRPELIGAAMDLPSFPSARRSRLRAVRTGAATILVVACLASGVSACSDVDDTPNTQSETSMSGADSDVASEAGSGRSDERPPNADGEIGNCADTDVSLTIPDAGVEGPLAVQSAQAIEIADGAAYTLSVNHRRPVVGTNDGRRHNAQHHVDRVQRPTGPADRQTR